MSATYFSSTEQITTHWICSHCLPKCRRSLATWQEWFPPRDQNFHPSAIAAWTSDGVRRVWIVSLRNLSICSFVLVGSWHMSRTGISTLMLLCFILISARVLTHSLFIFRRRRCFGAWLHLSDKKSKVKSILLQVKQFCYKSKNSFHNRMTAIYGRLHCFGTKKLYVQKYLLDQVDQNVKHL